MFPPDASVVAFSLRGLHVCVHKSSGETPGHLFAWSQQTATHVHDEGHT